MSKPNSPIDQFFESLYGFVPSKKGVAYELLANAAIKVLHPELDISYDLYLKDLYSDTKFQLDGLISSSDNAEKTMLEAKDYTTRKTDGAVGRGDLQKEEAALNSLDVQNGIFASATGYSSDAVKWAESTKLNPLHKPINLYDIRQSTIEDEKGRIKEIHVQLHLYYNDEDNAKVETQISPTDEQLERIKQGDTSAKPVRTRDIILYNFTHSPITNVEEITKTLNHEMGATLIDETITYKDTYLFIQGEYVLLHALHFSIPVKEIVETIVVKADGTPCVYVNNNTTGDSTLLTDVQLRNVEFVNNKVILKNKL